MFSYFSKVTEQCLVIIGQFMNQKYKFKFRRNGELRNAETGTFVLFKPFLIAHQTLGRITILHKYSSTVRLSVVSM